MPWLIQGFYFQPTAVVATEPSVTGPGEVELTLIPLIMARMWSGIISEDPLGSGAFVGKTMDDLGDSSLSDIEILPERIAFTKQYDHRRDTIRYSLARHKNYWLGEYWGDAVGRGMARCILTEVPDVFFKP